MVQDISELAPILREAFKIANSGRKGPVLVDIPKDITAAVTEFETVKPEPIADTTVLDADKIKAVAKLVNSAKRPILELGGGVISSEASEVTRAFVEKTGIPTCRL